MAVVELLVGDYGFALGVGLYAAAALAAPLLGVRASKYMFGLAALWGLIYGFLVLGQTLPGGVVSAFSGYIVLDSFSAFLETGAALVLLLAAIGLSGLVDGWSSGEAFYAAMGLMALGIHVLAGAGVLQLVYAAWVLAAITSYVLVALRRDRIAAEAALKYAATGAIATVVLLLGITLAYQAYEGYALGPAVVAGGATAVLAFAFIVSAAGFKIGIVPFQAWMPDVYGNSDPAVVSVIASIAKIASVLILVRLIAPLASLQPETLFDTVAVLAAITMLYGNIGALATVRDSPQKTLAYSSIAQAGYLAAAVAALARLPGAENQAAIAGLALHTLAYALSKLAAFQALAAAGCGSNSCGWAALRGLVRRSPATAFALVVAMASLAGIPVTLGFWGKLYIFLAVASISWPLALFMLANFGIAIFYYGYVIYQALLAPETGKTMETVAGAEVRGNTDIAATAAALLLVLLGLVAWQFYSLTVYPYP
ncbi:NADH-quinone oxidoreductase subunit N [Hyperthermus butylicus]|uniref:NADH-quinone oxidoreductase chain 14 n=1 Tax=Hyperthermus butylicus (strain DSM 5456 / JCM 9403 / PLM1-5) TaxID=415426 RepID=A2BJA3_HYPBU|nr:proton-conducting transporter membrane subunit [Hyperthermus butylicus]ABM80064.1 NADH-quinone oxidoreductase chain 14 [Hyperthermus butylicus DSM 5456]